MFDNSTTRNIRARAVAFAAAPDRAMMRPAPLRPLCDARTQARGLLVAAVLLLTALSPACAAQDARYPVAPYSDWTRLGEVSDDRMNEISGVAPSHRLPGHFYIHNDSGDEPRVMLLDRQARTVGEIRLKGAENNDFEDIAMAPGDQRGKWDVCVADIGDNGCGCDHLTIYRFAEPDFEPGSGVVVEVEPRAYRIKYPDGAVDAEGFCVHPQTGDGFVVTKQRDDQTSAVYRLPAPWPRGKIAVMQRVTRLPRWGRTTFERFVTAADISPDGKRVALRTYLGGLEWVWPEGAPPADLAEFFKRPPLRLELAPEAQAEAICYTTDSRGLITVSEQLPTFLYEVRRK